MLEQLFGSRTRWKLLKLFLTHASDKFFIREITRLSGERLNSVRRELINLEKWGLILAVVTPNSTLDKTKDKTTIKGKIPVDSRKFYQTNVSFPLFNEMKDLVMKSWLLVERNLASQLEKLGSIKLLMLTGRFVGYESSTTDVFIVGSVNREKLKKLMKATSRSFGEDIRYTIMTKKEFEYRKDITDRFLYGILESTHITVIDRLSPKIVDV